jgi:hypothetical protein
MTTAPFEIKVVYDASRRRGRGAVVRSAAQRGAIRIDGVILVGAALHLLVAAAMYWVTWWKVDRDILYMTMLKATPFEISPDFATNPIPFVPRSRTRAEPPPEPQIPVQETATITGPRWGGKTAQWLIGATAYGWLTLATVASCAVAMAAGAWFGVVGGHWVRVFGFIGLVALVCGVGYFAYQIWAEYKMMSRQLRVGMGWVILLMALLGLALAARARGITKLAGVSVVIAAAGTATGIWLWVQTGALEAQYASWVWLCGAFLAHAAWGFILLGTASRVRG